MSLSERAELALRLRADALIADGEPSRDTELKAVAELERIADALLAVGVLDAEAVGAVMADLQVARELRNRWVDSPWLAAGRRLRSPGLVSWGGWVGPGPPSSPPSPVTPVLPAPQIPVPPTVINCSAVLSVGSAEVRFLWLTSSNGATFARLVLTLPEDADEGDAAGSVKSPILPARGRRKPGEAQQHHQPLRPLRQQKGDRLGRARHVLDDIEIVDEAGVAHRMSWGRYGGTSGAWQGEAEIHPSLAPSPGWFDVRIAPKNESFRVLCEAPHPSIIGRVAEDNSTPAERYLRHLLDAGASDRFGPAASGSHQDLADSVWNVAEVFFDLGLVTRGSEALRDRTKDVVLPGAADARASDRLGGDRHDARLSTRGIGALFPLERRVLLLEGITATGPGLPSFHFWIDGDLDDSARTPWFRFVDERGLTYENWMRGSSSWLDGATHFEISLLGDIDPSSRTLRVFAESPFESAFVDVELLRK